MADGQQRVALTWICTQHELRDGFALRAPSAMSRQNDLLRISNERAGDLVVTREASTLTVASGSARQSALLRPKMSFGISTRAPSREWDVGALPTNRSRSLLPTMTYRRNAARVAAAVSLKYSGGRMKPHSRNFTPSLTARR